MFLQPQAESETILCPMTWCLKLFDSEQLETKGLNTIDDKTFACSFIQIVIFFNHTFILNFMLV